MQSNFEDIYTSVQDEEKIYRRGYPDKRFMNPDGTATSRVFIPRKPKDDKPGDDGQLSIDVEHLVTPHEAGTERGRWPVTKFALYVVDVKDISLLQLSCYYQPLTLQEHGKDNPSHGFIWGIECEEEDVLATALAKSSRRVTF